MNKNLKTVTLAALVLLTSCSKDENSPSGDTNDQAIEALESTPLEANSVADNVVITGGAKNDGVPPTPNEAISLDVSGSSGTAFLNEGFEISINSNAAIVGAYLQFKANDGTIADSYYDIDLNANAFKTETRKTSKFAERFAKKTSKRQDDATVDVDFNAQLQPGTFCYVVCVYDAEGNISAPEEVCVTVEAWGGNSEAHGVWTFTEQESTEDGVVTTQAVGEEVCEAVTVFCANQEELIVQECFSTISAILTLREDGSFVLESSIDEDFIDYSASAEQCTEIRDNISAALVSEGNWAYVSSENRLTLVEYGYSETYADGTIEEENYVPGDGELLYDGNAEINGNSMVIVEEDDYDGDGVIDFSYRYFFEK